MKLLEDDSWGRCVVEGLRLVGGEIRERDIDDRLLGDVLPYNDFSCSLLDNEGLDSDLIRRGNPKVICVS